MVGATSLTSRFYYVFNLYVLNSILFAIFIWMSLSCLRDYQFIENYSKPMALNNLKFNRAIESLKITVDDVLTNSPSVLLQNQDFKILSPYGKEALLGELTLEFQDKYLNFLDLLQSFAESKALGKISYLKLQKDPSNALSIGLKSYIIVEDEKRDEQETN
jgi:hypothetical protein